MLGLMWLHDKGPMHLREQSDLMNTIYIDQRAANFFFEG